MRRLRPRNSVTAGLQYVARLFGCDEDTVHHGMQDVVQLPEDVAPGRVRKKGGPKES